MYGRGSWVLAAATLAVVGLAGCTAAASSTGSTASPSNSASVPAQTGGAATVAPGHDTPQDAADGLIQAELARNQQLLCTYFVPAQQAACRGLQPSLPTGGHVSVVGAITSGDLALVEITGQVCVAANECQTSNDPSVGLPTGSVTFAQAYHKALTTPEFSPVPCKKVNGQWYVDSQSS
jgi:hypothetical protein